MQSCTCWYQCPQGHRFEVGVRVRHFFCQLCRKIYALKGKACEVVRLVKIGKKLIPADNKQTVKKLRSRNNSYSESYRKKNPASRQLEYINNKEHIVQRVKEWKQAHQKETRMYMRHYIQENRKSIRNYKRDWERGMIALSLMGLNPEWYQKRLESMKRSRRQAKLKKLLAKMNLSALICPMCNGQMDLKESGARYCKNKACKYFIQPSSEILAIIKNK